MEFAFYSSFCKCAKRAGGRKIRKKNEETLPRKFARRQLLQQLSVTLFIYLMLYGEK